MNNTKQLAEKIAYAIVCNPEFAIQPNSYMATEVILRVIEAHQTEQAYVSFEERFGKTISHVDNTMIKVFCRNAWETALASAHREHADAPTCVQVSLQIAMKDIEVLRDDFDRMESYAQSLKDALKRAREERDVLRGRCDIFIAELEKWRDSANSVASVTPKDSPVEKLWCAFCGVWTDHQSGWCPHIVREATS